MKRPTRQEEVPGSQGARRGRSPFLRAEEVRAGPGEIRYTQVMVRLRPPPQSIACQQALMRDASVYSIHRTVTIRFLVRVYRDLAGRKAAVRVTKVRVVAGEPL